MFVLKSTFDKTAKMAKAACISREMWRKTAQTNGRALSEKIEECEALQAKIARMTGGLRQNQRQNAA